MKVLTLSIKRKYFDEILAGTKIVETREIRPNVAKRYVHFVHKVTREVYETDLEAEEAGVLEDCWCNPIKYDAIKLLNGCI